MKRPVVLIVLLALCGSLWATGPVSPSDEAHMIKVMIAALAAQLARLSAAACTEDIGPTLRAELESTIEACIIILDALGLQLRSLPGTRG